MYGLDVPKEKRQFQKTYVMNQKPCKNQKPRNVSG